MGIFGLIDRSIIDLLFLIFMVLFKNDFTLKSICCLLVPFNILRFYFTILNYLISKI